MKKLLIPKIILIICFIVMLFSLFNIINWFNDNKKTSESIKLVQNITKVEVTPKSNFLSVDFDELYKTNNEVVAWIQVPDTNVNYPVVKHKNNSYYLNHSYDRSWNYAGWIYLDYRNDIDDLVSNNIIYGHGRVDGSMFGSLRDLLNLDGSRKVINISTPYNNYIFEIFSVYRISNTNDYLYTGFDNNEDFLKFIDSVKDRSLVKYSLDEFESSDKILTLATCYDTKEKFVVHAKLVDWERRF